jgi:hypothetical protein
MTCDLCKRHYEILTFTLAFWTAHFCVHTCPQATLVSFKNNSRLDLILFYFREKRCVYMYVYLLPLHNGPWYGLTQVHVLGVVQDPWSVMHLGLQIAIYIFTYKHTVTVWWILWHPIQYKRGDEETKSMSHAPVTLSYEVKLLYMCVCMLYIFCI